MELTRELYYDYIGRDEYMNNPESDATLKCYAELSKCLNGDVPDEVMSYAAEREEFGFVTGFRYAARILAECMISKGA